MAIRASLVTILGAILNVVSVVQSRLPCGGIDNKYFCKEGDPSTFLICVTGYEYEFHCPPGLHFNMRVSNCDWPAKSTCEFQQQVIFPPANVPINDVASYDEPHTIYPSTTMNWRPRTWRTTRRPPQDMHPGRTRWHQQRTESPQQQDDRQRYDQNQRQDNWQRQNQKQPQNNWGQQDQHHQNNWQRKEETQRQDKWEQQDQNQRQDKWKHQDQNQRQDKWEKQDQNQRQDKWKQQDQNQRQDKWEKQDQNQRQDKWKQQDQNRGQDKWERRDNNRRQGQRQYQEERPRQDNRLSENQRTQQVSRPSRERRPQQEVVKPQHKQLAQNSLSPTTSRVDPRLTWTPSDPWAPIITTPGLQRTTRYDGAPTVAPTEAPWHATTGWKEEEIKPRPVRLTPRTPQVAWREKKMQESQERITSSTSLPTTRERKWWQRRTTTEEPPSPSPLPERMPVQQKLPPVSGECTAQKCFLPLCRCAGNDIPGGLPVKQVPQMVMLTFDDEVSIYNFPYFRKLFTKGRNNPNGCPIKGTFFVSSVASDFSKVRELYRRGHEIASHSKSHRFPHSWWSTASYEDYKDEIEGMRKLLVKKSGIPYRDVKGMRVPFLQIGGDNQYKMLHDHGFLYDSSMVTGHVFRDKRPPLWPFTLDYPVDWKYSSLEPRPKGSYRGLWEVPLIRLYGNDARACSMADSCTPTRTPQMSLKYLRDNFLRYYTTNRAPLGIFIHARWFQREPYALTALEQFVEKLSQMDDVWLVTVSQVIEWTRSPTPISALNNFEPFKC